MMDSQRRSELKQAYKERVVPMGVMQMRCVATGERFLIATKSLDATRNGMVARLDGGWYPNKRLQALWNEQGEGGFAFEMVEELERDPAREAQGGTDDDLAELLELCLERDPDAVKAWR